VEEVAASTISPMVPPPPPRRQLARQPTALHRFSDDITEYEMAPGQVQRMPTVCLAAEDALTAWKPENQLSPPFGGAGELPVPGATGVPATMATASNHPIAGPRQDKENDGHLSESESDSEESVRPVPTLVALGGTGMLGIATSVQLFHAGSQAWVPLPDTILPRVRAAAAVHDNRIYVFGGDNAQGALEMLDPTVASTWVALRPSTACLAGCQANTVGDYIYISGGVSGNQVVHPRFSRYHPASDSWEERAPMPEAKCMHAQCVLEERYLLCAGGVDYNHNASATGMRGTRQRGRGGGHGEQGGSEANSLLFSMRFTPACALQCFFTTHSPTSGSGARTCRCRAPAVHLWSSSALCMCWEACRPRLLP
jgi:hypothetical protein